MNRRRVGETNHRSRRETRIRDGAGAARRRASTIRSPTPSPNRTISKTRATVRGALRVLMGLCQADLRCLDAHAHLGNLAFEHDARTGDPSLQSGRSDWRVVVGLGLRRLVAVGLHRQPAFSSLPSRIWTLLLAPGPIRRSRTRLRSNALAQPVGQPGCRGFWSTPCARRRPGSQKRCDVGRSGPRDR